MSEETKDRLDDLQKQLDTLTAEHEFSKLAHDIDVGNLYDMLCTALLSSPGLEAEVTAGIQELQHKRLSEMVECLQEIEEQFPDRCSDETTGEIKRLLQQRGYWRVDQ